MPYETRIILFVDILGFTNDVNKSSEDENKFETLKTTLEYIQSLFNIEDHDEIEKLQFSDSLVISMNAYFPGAVYHMVCQASFAMHALFANGYLCKGIISIGYLYHKGDILFGPEFLNVMKAEGLQKDPIITFDQDLIEVAKINPSPAQRGYENVELEYIMNHADPIPGTSKYKIAWYKDYGSLVGAGNADTYDHYEKIKNNIENNIRSFKKVRVLKKYLFLKDEFNNSEYIRAMFTNGIVVKPNNWKRVRLFPKTIVSNAIPAMKRAYWKMQ